MVTRETILDCVSAEYKIAPAAIKSSIKNRNITQARFVAYLLLRHYYNDSYAEIAKFMGRSTHGPVHYGLEKIVKRAKTDRVLWDRIQRLSALIDKCLTSTGVSDPSLEGMPK